MNLEDLKKLSSPQFGTPKQPESMAETIRRAEEEALKTRRGTAGLDFAKQQTVGEALAGEAAMRDRLTRDAALGVMSPAEILKRGSKDAFERINATPLPDLGKPYREQRAREVEQLELSRRQLATSEESLRIARAEADAAKAREEEEKALRVAAEKGKRSADALARASVAIALAALLLAAWPFIQ